MSAKGVLDGTFNFNTSIDVEEFETGFGIFRKIGNICSLAIKNYYTIAVLASTTYSIVFQTNIDGIEPFIPKSLVNKDFFLFVNGTVRWCTFSWDPTLTNMSIGVGAINAGDSISISFSEPIIYITN